MPIEIRRASFFDFLDAPNADALVAEYAEESAVAGLPAPKAQRELYERMESAGLLYTLIAFDGDTVVGVLSMVISINAHYSVVTAVSESYFVASAYRKSGAGLKLLREGEKLAREMGAVGLLVSGPNEGRLAEIMPHLGYRASHYAFFKVLQ